MRQQILQGIVLKQIPYKDADQLLTIFTLEKGKQVFVAKGIRKLTSRKRGFLSTFSLVKFQAIETHIPLITEVTPVKIYSTIQSNLSKLSVAYYFAEIVQAACEESTAHPDIFKLLVNSLKKLDEEDNLKEIRLSFAKEILIDLGFWPAKKPLPNPDVVLEEVIERKLASIRIGKQIQ